MKKIDFKLKPTFNLLGIVLLIGFTSITLGLAQESAKESKIPAIQKPKNGTRILISTSGPVKFTSYWLDNPPRLAVEFETKNVVSKIGSEILVNEGAIKRITSEYYGGAQSKILKSLTFELQEKVPYKIWQESDTIILDIQTPTGVSVFLESDREVFAKNETKDVLIQRLSAMETALKEVSTDQPIVKSPLENPKILLGSLQVKRKNTGAISLFWLIGSILISGLGLAWLFWRRYRLILDKNIAAKEVVKLKAQLQEQNKFLEHEQIIRKTIENTSLIREKEFEQVSKELQKGKQLLEQEEKARKTVEEELSQKEKECTEVKGSLESMKEVLVEKGLAKKLSTPEKEGELWIAGKSAERREFPRLDLSKDYNRTIILRIETEDKSNPSTSLGISPEQSRRAKSIKSFANNISTEGLCFETRREFKEKESINLRLFFFGDNVPMIRTKAKVIWSRADLPINYYGISFVSLEEKDKTELKRYIESKISECTTYGMK